MKNELEKKGDGNNNNNDDEEEEEEEDEEKIINSPQTDYWYPPICEQKTKIAITDITSDNVTITFREII